MNVRTFEQSSFSLSPPVDPSMAELRFGQPDIIRNPADRWLYLARREHEGFTPSQRRQTVDDIVVAAFPVDNIQRLQRRPSRLSDELTLGSWGVGDENYGEFTVYQVLDWLPREHTGETVTHESSHVNSPFDPNNARFYGGERQRQEAARFAERLAQQSVDTNRYLDPYHRNLARLLKAEKIEEERFKEETWAIACQHALTDRAHLLQVQDAQRASLERRQRGGLLPQNYEFTELMSHRTPDGRVELGGVDKPLVRLLHGVNDYNGLMRHVQKLKTHFSGPAKERPPIPEPRWIEPAIGVIVLGPIVIRFSAN